MASAETLHATSVACHGRGLLILGASGQGKSALALDLMARGARLVADDRTVLQRDADQLWLSCPPGLTGLIEARGVGLLNADPAPPTPLGLVVDLDRQETERLPPHRTLELLGLNVPVVHKVTASYFPAALMQYLGHGRRD